MEITYHQCTEEYSSRLGDNVENCVFVPVDGGAYIMWMTMADMIGLGGPTISEV